MTDNKEITHNDVALATFTKLAAKIDAVPENALRTVNVDVPTAIPTVEHAYDKFAPFADAAKKRIRCMRTRPSEVRAVSPS